MNSRTECLITSTDAEGPIVVEVRQDGVLLGCWRRGHSSVWAASLRDKDLVHDEVLVTLGRHFMESHSAKRTPRGLTAPNR